MIFILTELYYPEETSTGYYLTQIAEALAQKEEITVITSVATSGFIPLPDYPNYQLKNQVKIYRCGGTSFNKDQFWGRLVNGLTRSCLIFRKALKLCEKNDIIIVVTNPPLLPFMGLFLKWLKRIKLVILIHDLYPEVLVATGLWKPHSVRVKLAQSCNKILYQQANRIITLGRDMTERINDYLRYQAKDKIKMIPHWADLKAISPQPKLNNSLLQQLKLTDKFVILYSGNIGRTHRIENLVEVAKKLKIYPVYHFIIAGVGYKKQWLIEEVKKHQLINITLLEPVLRQELNHLLNACDIGIVALIAGMSGVSVPSRVYNHLASGKPLIAIAESSSEIAKLITENELGWVVAPSDIMGLVKIIKLAKNSPDCCFKMGQNSLRTAQNDYTFQHTLDAYQFLLSELKDDTN